MQNKMTLTEWYKHLVPVIEAMDKGLAIETAESMDSKVWTECTGKNFKTDRVYRIKKVARFCNGVQLYPCLDTLKGKCVYIADPMSESGASKIEFNSYISHEQIAGIAALRQLGMVYGCEEHAAHHGKAMRITTEG